MGRALFAVVLQTTPEIRAVQVNTRRVTKISVIDRPIYFGLIIQKFLWQNFKEILKLFFLIGGSSIVIDLHEK